MIFQNPPFRRSSAARSAGLLLLSMLFAAPSGYPDQQDISVAGSVPPACKVNTDFSYAAFPTQNVNEVIGPLDVGDNVEWSLIKGTMNCSIAVNLLSAVCGGLTITIPSGIVAKGNKPTLKGTPVGEVAEGFLTMKVTDAAVPNLCGIRQYRFRTINNGSGWGDPHMKTVDGVHYDFQSAGEFTALRQDGFVIQTRQRAVSSSGPGGVNEYTGLGTCVSLYSAVAARVGSNRVSLQPNLSGQPDPSGLQLRVNGQLVTLTDSGIDLRAGGSAESSAKLEGRIVKAAGGAYEFDDAFGTQLVATPAYWDAHQTWYLNLNVYQTIGTEGVWGRRAPDSWLPALPDGKSLGSRPQAADQRYQDLYGKFADAWRVTDATSLFDYAPGTNTATFTMADWPRFNPTSCLVQGEPPAQPATPQVAQQACSAITDPAQKADCVFDVTVTGFTGFAQTYETMQRFQPHGSGWQPVLAGVLPGPIPPPPTPWWWWIPILILLLILIAVLIARKKKTA